LPPSVVGVALSGPLKCDCLPSTGITPLPRYYSVIRLLTRRLAPLLCYHLSAILRFRRAGKISQVDASRQCRTCQALRPRGSRELLAHCGLRDVAFCYNYSISLPVFGISGLNHFS
ncbi:MAG: hypothetical protein QMC95_02395, partial [Desulfitobacteriaceae bacterium]|nr:hypothetical protein [Desulfitobacteriaceae bacterium]